MLRRLFFFLIISISFSDCGSQQETTKATKEPITRVEMSLSAFGVEADDIPSITAHIDFLHDSSRCEKTYYNPAFKPSIYRLSKVEIEKILQLLEAADFNKLKSEYKVSKTDQPTSTTKIYIGQKGFVIRDYGLEGDYPLKKLYTIVYKF